MSSPIFKYNPPPAINLAPIYDDRSFNAAYKSAKDAKSEVDQQIALISQERLPIEEELAESREQVFAARKYITDTATSQAWFAIFTASVMTEQIHASPEIEQVENFLGMDEVTGGLLDTAKIGIDAWELGTKINNLVLKSRIIENAQVHLETLKVQHNNNLEDQVLKTRIAQTEDFINKQTLEHEKMKNELLNSSAKQAVFFTKDILSVLESFHQLGATAAQFLPVLWWINKTISLVDQIIEIKSSKGHLETHKKRETQAVEAMSAGSIDPSLAKAAEGKLEVDRTDDEHDQIDELTKLRTLLNKRLESEKSITRGGVDKLKQLKDKREIAHEKRLADQKSKLDQLLTDAFDIAKSNADNSTTFTSFFKTLQSKGIDLLSIIPSLKADDPLPIPQQTAKHGILSYFQKPVEIPIPAPAPLPTTPLHDIGLLLFHEAVATLTAIDRKALLDILGSDKSNVIKYTAMNMQFGHSHPIMQLLNMTGKQHLAIADIVNFLNEKEEVVDATDHNMMQKLMKITKDDAIQDKMLTQLTRHQDAMTISAQKGLQTLAKSKLEIEGSVLNQNVKNLMKSFATDFTKAVVYGIMSILILSGTTFGSAIFFPFIGALVISGALMCLSLYHLKKNNPNLYKGFWNISLHVGLRYDRRALAYKQNDLAILVQNLFEKSSQALKHNTLYYQLYYIKQKLDKDPNATIQTKDLSPIVQATYGQIIRTHRTQADQKQALDKLVEEYRIASFNNSSEINELNNRKIDLQRAVTEKQQKVEEKAEKIRKAVWQDFKLAANIKGNIDYASNEIAKALTNARVDPENDYMLEVEEILKRDFNIDLPQVREKLKQMTTAETAVNPEELKKQVGFLLREFYTRTHDEYAKFNKREAE